MNTPARRARGFTLVELLTVIAIVGILAAILIPVVGKVRSNARQSTCTSNLRQITGALYLYAADNKGFIPGAADQANGGDNPTKGFWQLELNPYVGKDRAGGNSDISEFFSCPTYFADNPAVGVWRRGYGMNTRSTRPLRAGTATADAVKRTRLAAWPEPARNVVFCESNRESFTTSSNGVFNAADYGTPDRHGSRSNYAFLDGSVRALDAAQAADALRWTQP